MSKYKYVCLALSLLNCLAFSNEAWLAFGRNDEIINVKAANIAMRAEVIEITLRSGHYEVDVTFDFFNDGPDEKVKLGFPVVRLNPDKATISDEMAYDFKSYVNGEAIPKYTIREDSLDVFGDRTIYKYVKWFIRDVTFPANKHTASRVTYKAEYSHNAGPLVAGYIYGTGRFWRNGIEKMTVIINHGDDVLIDLVRFGVSADEKSVRSPKFTWKANGRYTYELEKITPKNKNEQIFIFVVPFESGLYGDYWGQFGISGDYFTQSNMRRGLDIRHDPENPDHRWVWDEHLLYKNPSDIQLFTKNQIRLFINFFSAMHGYDFKNQQYKDYFQKLDQLYDKNSKKYKVNPNFTENDFNEVERKNVNYLLNLEKKIPAGP
jgi:hypothetical protein